jgi:hypothetical protein
VHRHARAVRKATPNDCVTNGDKNRSVRQLK